MAQVPGHPLGRDPGDEDRPARARLALAHGDGAGRVRDAPDARLPGLASRASTTCSSSRPKGADGRLRVHEHLVLAARRGRDLRPRQGRARRRPGLQRARASSASAPARSRRWPRSTASTSARSTKDDVERMRDDVKAGDDVLPDKQLAKRKAASKHWQEHAVIDNIDTILFKDIDEPGPEHARRLRQARRLRDAQEGAEDGAGRRPRRDARQRRARPRRRRLRDGPQDVLHPQGDDGQVPRLQRGRVRARDLQGPRADAEEPASADRGDHHRRLLHRRLPLVHLHPRRVRLRRRHPRRGRRRGARGGLPGREHPRLRPHDRPRGPPRRRRLHLRRGDRAAGLAGGQARQPAPEAAVPGRPGPLPGPDADQQRRDADERPGDPARWAAPSTPRSAPRPRRARS